MGKKNPYLLVEAREMIIMIFSLFCLSQKLYALVPLESLLLGDFSKSYEEKISDPLYSIFRDRRREEQVSSHNPKQREKFLKFVLYRGLIDEGQNLNNKCKQHPEFEYETKNELVNAKRVYLSTLQYLVLDLTTEYIARYAQYFDFAKNEYSNLVDNLVGNNCSENLSTISLTQLKKNMLARFSTDRGLALPSVVDDPFFPKALAHINVGHKARKQEFFWTLELFKASCSWANEVENARLLVPLARNPFIAAAVIREIAGLGFTWDENREKITKIPIKNALHISCNNLICRKTQKATFLKQIPRIVGSDGIESDFERLFCNDFRDIDYITKNQEPKIGKKIKQLTFDDQNMLTGQLVALISGYPDFMVQAGKYSDLMDYMRAPMDSSWSKWAYQQNGNYKKTMTFEESLTLDLVNPSLYYNKYRSKFQVELDVNQGEFDKAINVMGKLRIKIALKLSKKFLSWVRVNWKLIDEMKEPQKAERVRIPFRARFSDILIELKRKFPVVPFSDNFTQLVVEELIRQVSTYEGDYFSKNIGGFITIPLYINLSPYALRHMRYRYMIKKNEIGGKSDLAKLRNLSLSF